jgi:hypothetical protein
VTDKARGPKLKSRSGLRDAGTLASRSARLCTLRPQVTTNKRPVRSDSCQVRERTGGTVRSGDGVPVPHKEHRPVRELVLQKRGTGVLEWWSAVMFPSRRAPRERGVGSAVGATSRVPQRSRSRPTDAAAPARRIGVTGPPCFKLFFRSDLKIYGEAGICVGGPPPL